MTITDSQRTSIMITWTSVCKDRGWKSGDRALRLSTFSKLVGRSLASTNDVERIQECTKLMKELQVMLGVSVQAAREADDLSINAARVLRNQILTQLVPCLELYIADVAAYMAQIMEDKNRWWKIERPTTGMTLMDLNASQLKQMQFTLSARLNAKRKAAGQTIHEMKIEAGVHCNCSPCNKARWNEMSAAAQAEAKGVPVAVAAGEEPDWNV